MNAELLIMQRDILLDRQKELFKTLKSRKGQRAQNRPTRYELEDTFSTSRAAAAAAASSNGMRAVRQTVLGYAYSPCTIPLADLRPITIGELRLEENHEGRVLFVRTFGTPHRVQAVQGAVVDTAGDVDRIAIYNFETGRTPEMVLPRDTILAIKQPYYKGTLDGGVNIRVDHPSDLVIISDHDGRAPSVLRPSSAVLYHEQDALSWKVQGNQAFAEKNNRKAIELYTGGLSACRGDADALVRFDLFRNRAIANINLDRYEAGLADAEASLMPNSQPKSTENNAKAYYRAGCAAYQLGEFSKAKQSFTHVLNANSSDKDAIRQLKQTDKRLGEQTRGDYNFEQMADSVNLRHTRLDHADFTTKVCPRSSKTAGNGLFATVAIRAGELVLCEKAFAVAFRQDEATEETVVINLNRSSASAGTHATRLVATVHKMLHNPRQAAKFLCLYDGGYSPKPRSGLVDGIVPVDTFQVQAALESNGFGCPMISTVAPEDRDDTVVSSSTGAWVTASYVNHDCIGNVQRAFIGDMMIIHATKNIAKDEEILMRYKNADNDNTEFQKTMKRTWGFTCGCRLCAAESATLESARRVRMTLLEQARVFIDGNLMSQLDRPKPGAISKAEKLRAQIDSSYDSTLFKSLPRQGLHDLDHWLCMAYIVTGAKNKLREAGVAVLRDQGIELMIRGDKVSIVRPYCRPDITGVHAATYVAALYYEAGKKKLGDQLEALAQELYRMGHGTMRGYHSRSGSG